MRELHSYKCHPQELLITEDVSGLNHRIFVNKKIFSFRINKTKPQSLYLVITNVGVHFGLVSLKLTSQHLLMKWGGILNNYNLGDW